MATTTTQDIDQFLAKKAGGNVIETHAARIYLLDGEAWKVKRHVKYDYLDFRDLEDRRRVLLRELELNKPIAPTLYRDVVAITEEPDEVLAIGGRGNPVEWMLRMARFPAEDELSAIAARGGLTGELSRSLGQVVHHLHDNCPQRAVDGTELIAEIIEEFTREFRTLAQAGAKVDATETLAQLRGSLAEVSDLLTQRSGRGFVRRCHGDLHLRNLVLLDGVPTPFDALEFDERLGTCDVLYDLAFLLMDVVQNDLPDAANAILNAYCDLDRDLHALRGLRALPLFGGVRATVRAMVSAELQMGRDTEARDFSESHRYLALTRSLLRTAEPQLIAIGGLSGTGKTTIARALAPHIGAAFGSLHIRSDIERKRLAGVDPLDPLPADTYTPEASKMTYQAVLDRTEACLKAGQSVIADAVFAKEDERRAMAQLASQAGVKFAGVWLEASHDKRVERVEGRMNDASDADRRVVDKQSAFSLGAIDWHVVSTQGDIATTLARVQACLQG